MSSPSDPGSGNPRMSSLRTGISPTLISPEIGRGRISMSKFGQTCKRIEGLLSVHPRILKVKTVWSDKKKNGMDLLLMSIKENEVELVMLVWNRMSADEGDAHAALEESAKVGNMTLVPFFIALGGYVTYCWRGAFVGGQRSLVEFFLSEYSEKCNDVHAFGGSCYAGHREIAEEMFRRGADHVNNFGALGHSINKKKWEIAKWLLLEKGGQFQEALVECGDVGNIEMVRWCVENTNVVLDLTRAQARYRCNDEIEQYLRLIIDAQ